MGKEDLSPRRGKNELKSWTLRRLIGTALTASLILTMLMVVPQPDLLPRAEAAVEHVFDEFQGPTSGESDNVYQTNQLAQSFTASDNYRITKIKLFIKDMGNSNTINLTFAMNNPAKNEPGLPLTFAIADGPDGYVWVEFSLNVSVQLTMFQVYWIMLIDTVNQQPNGYAWAKRTTPPLYPGGSAASCSGSSCSSWNVDPNADYLFITYGIIGPSIVGSIEADSQYAGAGDPLQYTLHFDNNGSEYASKVWINMTYSPALTYVSDDSALYGGQRSSPNWLFTNVAVDPHLFHVNFTVGMVVFDGQLLLVNVTLQYANRFGNMQEDHRMQAVTTARVPSLSFSKSASPQYASQGGCLTFTLAFVNSGSRPADMVWTNDSLPPSVAYLWDTAANGTGLGNTSSIFNGSWILGRTLMYNFSTVSPGLYKFDIVTRINSSLLNGTEIVNQATLNYTDSSRRIVGPIFASATARIWGASMRVKKVTLDSPVAPGDKVNYEVIFTNEGTAQAAYAWINDTMPLGVTYVSDTADLENSYSASGSWRSGRELHLVFINVPQGAHSFIVTVQVDAGAPDGQVLTNSVCLSYTDWDTKLLTPSCAQSSAYVMIPTVAVFAQGPSTADPGDLITYDVVIVNLGTGRALYTWLNVTESQELSYYYDNSSLNGGLLVGPHTWRFDDLGPGSLILGFMYELRTGLSDGQNVSVLFEVDYTDYKGRPLGTNQASATTTVTVPVIQLEVVQDRASAPRGGTIVYTIYFNNTGSGTAANVWVNDTIPDQTTFRRSSHTIFSSSGGRITWRFVDVAPGPHFLTVNVSVDDQATVGSPLRNEVNLSYQDANGDVIDVQLAAVTAEVTDGGTPPLVELPAVQSNWIWLIVLALLLVLAVMWLFVARKFYGLGVKVKARIDEMFLLHRSGELIRHHSRSLRPEVDSDVLSAMLVAVQSFVKESFNFRAGDLEELKFGDQKIILMHGVHVILAAVVAGRYSQRIVPRMRQSLGEIESRFGPALEDWSGLTEDLPQIDDVLSKLFEDKAGK